ncbi:MAG: hypothetical protein ACTHMR_16320 [Thermomicrobiales bacterium]
MRPRRTRHGYLDRVGRRNNVAAGLDSPARARMLFAGAALLLVASLVIAVLGVGRFSAAAPTASPTAAPVALASTPAETPTPEPTATTVPTVTATVAKPTPTPRPPLTAANGCAFLLPTGFTEDRGTIGYYPADDHSGFVALDALTGGSDQIKMTDATSRFTANVLARAIGNFKQPGAKQLGDSYRLDFTATAANGKPGHGTLYVRQFTNVTCGATLYELNDSPIPFDTLLESLMNSLQADTANPPSTPTAPGKP